MQEEIEEGQEQLAKRQKPRRGYCLDLQVGEWFEGSVKHNVGGNSFKMTYDFADYATEKSVPAHRLVADGDILFVTYEEPGDPAEEEIHSCEVSVRDFNGQKDLVYLTNPNPVWELDDDLKPEEYVLNLNARTVAQKESNPTWAHTRGALDMQLIALAAAVPEAVTPP